MNQTQSIVELANLIRSGKLSAEKLLRETLERAIAAQEKCNCIVEFLETDAFKIARDIDNKIKDGHNFSAEEFPLLGVPISVKDFIDVKGSSTVGGNSDNVGKVKTEDSPVIYYLRKSGAIPFCKTNVPQFPWCFEGSNPVLGRTSNPYNLEFTSGGSSSGEGALIGSNGSYLGIGSDIGGSVRIPAHYCGIYSFKPTSSIIPVKGHYRFFEGFTAITGVIGPMATSVKNLQAFMDAILNQKPWLTDSSLIPLPWNTYKIPETKLKIGYYTNDGFSRVSPVCIRAVNLTVETLRKAGHELIPFKPPRAHDAFIYYMQAINADKMQSCIQNMSHKDPFDDSIKNYLYFFKCPDIVKYSIAYIAEKCGETTVARFIRSFCFRTGAETWENQYQIQTYRTEYYNTWQSQISGDGKEMDAIICPVGILPAHPHWHHIQTIPSMFHTMLYNLLDMPAGVIPVTRVEAGKDILFDYENEDVIGGTMYQDFTAKLYDSYKMDGLPVGIQVVGVRYQDDKVLKIMELIDNLLKSQ